MALVEGCKYEIEITVPQSEVDAETERAVAKIQQKVKLPGFRPGKAPASIVRNRFAAEIRQDVLEALIPRFVQKRIEDENLQVVSRPNVTDLHFHAGEPLRFKAEFEVAPQIELGEYRGITVEYREPVVTEADIDERLEKLRDQKAEFVNVDPRPLQDGDYAVFSLKSLAGVAKPVEQEEVTLLVGGEDTMPAFTEALRGATPGEQRRFQVSYPDDYGQDALAGKTVEFEATVKAIRLKELPEVNDEFARDLGDFQDLQELWETLRKSIFQEREIQAQHEAKEKIVDQLVAAHEFPVPEVYVERQSEIQLENQLRPLVAQGLDPSKLNVDWNKLKASQRDRALRDVKASLLISRIAEREAIEVMQDEVDREVHRIAKQRREMVPVVRQALEKDGSIARIAGNIRSEKTLNFLFENARKVAPAE